MMQSKSSCSRKLLPLFAMSFAMMFGAFLLPAYGQQEVSPDWFDPWAPPTQVAQTSQGKAAKNQPQPHPAKVKSASTTRIAKARVKKNTKQRPS